MEIQIPPEMEARIGQLAAQTGRNVEQLTLEMLNLQLDYECNSVKRLSKHASLYGKGALSRTSRQSSGLLNSFD